MKAITGFLLTAGLGAMLIACSPAANDTTKPGKSDVKSTTTGKAYPLSTCIVSGEKLDSMGKPYVFTHAGQEIRLCCESCKKDFLKEPAKFLAKLSDAAKDAKKEPAPAKN